MSNGELNWIANFIWGIADDVLRDLYVRGKYRDVILPMTVLRRLDAVLEPTKQQVIDTKASLDKARIANQDAALRSVSGQAFYNTSKFTLRDLRSRANQQQLKADFEAYLDGFSPNVQEIFDSFEFRNQIPRMSKADILGTLIERFLDPSINLSPDPVLNGDGSVKHPGLDNHTIGTIFEELVRRFNEENNEEAGEHWTPRDAVKLMANLVLLPIADQIESGTYLVYDGACGTGGMLSVAEETLQQLASEHGKEVAIHLYGQEISAETYAIAKGDLLLKGEGEAADNLVGGPEHSTLSNDAFPAHEFDFMLSNPPYGKSWKTDLERMGGKNGLKDQRFVIQYAGESSYSLVTRSSDGQMLFLANLLSKMKHGTKLGSRIAEVHNGSSLFSGDAGQGESNIRRWIVESDWLEAVIALPLNMFYNTGIATFIWVITNRKAAHRKGKVQLIDASEWYKPLRKNLGKKNCELSPKDIDQILKVFLGYEEAPQSKIFDNADLGYWKVTVERPLRATGIDPERAYSAAEIKALKDGMQINESGAPIIRRILKGKDAVADPLHGRFAVTVGGERRVVEYEADGELRDTEQVPLQEPGGIEAFIAREVLLYTPDAWINDEKTQVGYEINFSRYFYKPKPLRSLQEIRADIIEVERRSEGLLSSICGIQFSVRVDLARYPAVKASGFPWLGEVPEHWDVRRLKVAAANVNDQTTTPATDEGYVALEHVESWTGRFRSTKPHGDFDSQVKRFKDGDVLFGKLRPYLAKVARPTVSGVCVGEFLVLRARERYIASTFLEQFLRCKPVIDAVSSSTFGAKMPRADWNFVGGMAIAIPPPSEQASIVRFLTHADHLTRKYIGAKRKLIALLDEQKQAIIERAITRGFDPSIRLKPSGVEWLGDIPESWQVAKLKHLVQKNRPICYGILKPGESNENGTPMVRAQDYSRGWKNLGRDIVNVSKAVELPYRRSRLSSGDLLITVVGAGIGNVEVVPDWLDGANISRASARIAVDSSVASGAFLRLALASPLGKRNIALTLTGSAQPVLNLDDVGRFLLPLPSKAEQLAIAERLEPLTNPFDSAIERTKCEVKLISEYHARLRFDVVTGNYDVRNQTSADFVDSSPYAVIAGAADAEDSENFRKRNSRPQRPCHDKRH